MKTRALLFALAAHAALLILGMPASPWEFDEPLFFQALHRYDPLAHHPPPPGYPLFIFAGKLVRMLVPSDFGALVAISLVASIAAFVMLALAFRNLAGDETAGIAGALLFYLSPALLVHATLPISEPGALALFATSLYFASREDNPALFALFAALAIGWRIQFAIFVLPFLLLRIALLRGWRSRLIALGTFTAVCLAWLIPLAIAVGGLEELVALETGQGQYLASHDAAESRTGWTPARIAFRFIGRAWGKEWMALVVLAAAAIGFFAMIRRRAVLPLLAGGAVYIGVALWVMDPADGVRYAIPFVLVTAFLAGAGVTRIARRWTYAAVAVFALAFVAYTSSLLLQRRLTPSPPVRAAEWVRANLPANAVALYELPLWPHATYYFGDRNPHRVDDGLAKFYNRADVPLFIYADGATTQPGAQVFRWRTSDAYEKLTRNHYRAASIIPVPPERRFRVVEGISALEREQDGLEWRWLSSPAALQLPHGGARTLTLHLGLPRVSPLESNTIAIFVDGRKAAQTEVARGQRGVIAVAVPDGAPTIRFEAARTFIPAEVPSLRSGDRRRLAVELYALQTQPSLPPSAR